MTVACLVGIFSSNSNRAFSGCGPTISMSNMLHHPTLTPIEETLRALDDLVRQGKIRYWALSTYPAWRVVDTFWKADALGAHPPICLQVPYNLARREAELDIVPVCLANSLSLTVFSPLAGGLFAGASARQREFRWPPEMGRGGAWRSRDRACRATRGACEAARTLAGVSCTCLAGLTTGRRDRDRRRRIVRGTGSKRGGGRSGPRRRSA